MEPLYKQTQPSIYNQPVYLFQSSFTRALQVGYIQQNNSIETFIPGRLTFGPLREYFTFEGTKQTLSISPINTILHKYSPSSISTVTLLRETLSCDLGRALWENNIKNHFGDAFIGATHIKGDGEIKTSYQYENTEGLVDHGLWLIADSICIGRNLAATLTHLFSTYVPKEIILLAPLASRRGINLLGEICNSKKIPTTFVAWGGLLGVDEKTLYDMPWGHKDTEPLDIRDQQTFISMFGPQLCIGGDFGNNYYSPTLAKKLYDDQLVEHKVKPLFPSVPALREIYSKEEILTYTI